MKNNIIRLVAICVMSLAGAVLPFYGDEVENLNGNDEDIYVTVFPG